MEEAPGNQVAGALQIILQCFFQQFNSILFHPKASAENFPGGGAKIPKNSTI